MKSHLKFNAKIKLISDYACNQVISKRLLKKMLGFLLSTNMEVMTVTVDLDHANLFLVENKLLEAEVFSLKFLVNDLAGDYNVQITTFEDVATVALLRA